MELYTMGSDPLLTADIPDIRKNVASISMIRLIIFSVTRVFIYLPP